MRYLREHGCDWGAGNQVCRAAARGGSVAVLQWCVENGAAWGSSTCEAAAIGGHLDALKFALGRGCHMNERAAASAARHGNIVVLAYIFEHDGGKFTHPWILECAKIALQVGCVKLAVAHGCKNLGGGEPGAWWAGVYGRVDLAQWLMERAAATDKETCARVRDVICRGAACEGWLPVLQWMLDAGHLDLTDTAPAIAALERLDRSPRSHLPALTVLRLLHESGMRFDASVFEKAAERGNIEVLTWLWDVANCPLTRGVWNAAAEVAADHADADEYGIGHDVLKWLCVQPVRPWDDKLVLWALREADANLVEWALANEPNAAAVLRTRGCAAAISSDCVESVEWVRKHGGEWNTACTWALADASFSMVQHCVSDGCGVSEVLWRSIILAEDANWAVLEPRLQFLKDKGCPRSTATTVAAALNEDEVSAVAAVRWLLANGCPVDAFACAAAARQFPHSRVVELHKLGCPVDGSVCVAAAEAGQLDTLQWAHSKGCALGDCAGLVVRSAAVQEWLWAQGVECRRP
jgi:hypothetical protein